MIPRFVFVDYWGDRRAEIEKATRAWTREGDDCLVIPALSDGLNATFEEVTFFCWHSGNRETGDRKAREADVRIGRRLTRVLRQRGTVIVEHSGSRRDSTWDQATRTLRCSFQTVLDLVKTCGTKLIESRQAAEEAVKEYLRPNTRLVDRLLPLDILVQGAMHYHKLNGTPIADDGCAWFEEARQDAGELFLGDFEREHLPPLGEKLAILVKRILLPDGSPGPLLKFAKTVAENSPAQKGEQDRILDDPAGLELIHRDYVSLVETLCARNKS
jgi:hypothetical protein